MLDPTGSIHRRKSSQSSLKSFMSNPEYYLRESSPTSEESSIDSWGSVNNNSGGYRRQHRKSSPSRLYGESGHRSASDLSSMILQHQYNHQMLRIRRLNSYAGRFECRFCACHIQSTLIYRSYISNQPYWIALNYKKKIDTKSLLLFTIQMKWFILLHRIRNVKSWYSFWTTYYMIFLVSYFVTKLALFHCFWMSACCTFEI